MGHISGLTWPNFQVLYFAVHAFWKVTVMVIVEDLVRLVSIIITSHTPCTYIIISFLPVKMWPCYSRESIFNDVISSHCNFKTHWNSVFPPPTHVLHTTIIKRLKHWNIKNWSSTCVDDVTDGGCSELLMQTCLAVVEVWSGSAGLRGNSREAGMPAAACSRLSCAVWYGDSWKAVLINS